MKKKNCSNCYIEIKELHIFRGIVLCIFLSIMLYIPILNVFVCSWWFKDGQKGEMRTFWDGCFYDYVKHKVKETNTI